MKTYCVVVESLYSAADTWICYRVDDCRNLLNPAWGIITIITRLVSASCLWDYVPFSMGDIMFIYDYVYIYIYIYTHRGYSNIYTHRGTPI